VLREGDEVETGFEPV